LAPKTLLVLANMRVVAAAADAPSIFLREIRFVLLMTLPFLCLKT
jgi:hypothetical protein